jgi:hypothetical protein
MQTEKTADRPPTDNSVLKEKLQQATKSLAESSSLKSIFIDASDPKHIRRVEF